MVRTWDRAPEKEPDVFSTRKSLTRHGATCTTGSNTGGGHGDQLSPTSIGGGVGSAPNDEYLRVPSSRSGSEQAPDLTTSTHTGVSRRVLILSASQHTSTAAQRDYETSQAARTFGFPRAVWRVVVVPSYQYPCGESQGIFSAS